MTCLRIKYRLCLHCFKFFFFFFHNSLINFTSSSWGRKSPKPATIFFLLPLISDSFTSQRLKLCNVYHIVQNYYKFQLFYILVKGCLENHSNSPSISFHFSKKKKKILTFLHFLYHVNHFYYYLNNKKKLTIK
jgi:hypothetical protein